MSTRPAVGRAVPRVPPRFSLRDRPRPDTAFGDRFSSAWSATSPRSLAALLRGESDPGGALRQPPQGPQEGLEYGERAPVSDPAGESVARGDQVDAFAPVAPLHWEDLRSDIGDESESDGWLPTLT
jgi:hypothetical protein